VERRVILAIVLMLIVAVLPGILFPPKKPPARRPGGPGGGDTAAVARESVVAPPAPVPQAGRAPERASAPIAPAETVWVTSPLYRMGFTTRGARLIWASCRLIAPSPLETRPGAAASSW